MENKHLIEPVIIPVRIEDLEELRALSVCTFTDAFSAQNTPENMAVYIACSFERDKLLAELMNPDSYFYFAKVNGKTTGYLKLNVASAQSDLTDQHGMEIERIYVSPEYQGKRIGASLMQFALIHAKRLSRDFIWLGVWEKNERAIHFYRKFGFEEFGRHPFMLGSELQTDLLFKRVLSPY
jgi:diamine N-acetyltransferase